MGKLQIMDHTGHTTIPYDKDKCAEAMEKFDALIKDKYTAAKKGEDGKFTVSRTFDPTAEEVIMIPQLQGG